jgi:hypothetical protein
VCKEIGTPKGRTYPPEYRRKTTASIADFWLIVTSKQQVEGPGDGRRTASAVPDDGTLYRCQNGFALSDSALEVAVTNTGSDIDPGRVRVNPGRR